MESSKKHYHNNDSDMKLMPNAIHSIYRHTNIRVSFRQEYGFRAKDNKKKGKRRTSRVYEPHIFNS